MEPTPKVIDKKSINNSLNNKCNETSEDSITINECIKEGNLNEKL